MTSFIESLTFFIDIFHAFWPAIDFFDPQGSIELQPNSKHIMPREGLLHWEVTNMSTHIRTWGIALTAVVAFAVPHLATQAETTTMAASMAQAAVASTTPAVQTTLNLKVTAYTSLADETDDTPFITADGSYVHDGIVATNLLPFGTKVMIPSLFGDKIFTVDDRMSKRMDGHQSCRNSVRRSYRKSGSASG
jgi:3D (Asp-Asp-Asp) domain-containing protein